MALNIDTQDLNNYPGTTKRVTIDMDSIVPTGFEGDEQYVMSVATSAYSNNTNRTSIQSMYITDYKAGWCKSSGFAGTSGKFSITDSQKNLKIKIDATVSGTDGNGYYTITLTTSDSAISGESIAADMETKIRALGDSLETADTGYALAYKNATVEFDNNKFWIVSGSISQYYTGSYRSSVEVAAAATNDASLELGFNMPMTSLDLAGISVKEVALGSNYTAGGDTITTASTLGASMGDPIMITDGVNTDYFTAMSGTTGTTIKVPTTASYNYDGISNNYYTASGTKLQLLREQDPDGEPKSYYTDIDSVVRLGVKTMMSQIDYSS